MRVYFNCTQMYYKYWVYAAAIAAIFGLPQMTLFAKNLSSVFIFTIEILYIFFNEQLLFTCIYVSFPHKSLIGINNYITNTFVYITLSYCGGTRTYLWQYMLSFQVWLIWTIFFFVGVALCGARSIREVYLQVTFCSYCDYKKFWK